jgi:hypothetical protein
LFRRQALEQNFTSSQLRAQRRRQVIGSPHATQGLLGSAALLPRNEEAGFVIGNALKRKQAKLSYVQPSNPDVHQIPGHKLQQAKPALLSLSRWCS